MQVAVKGTGHGSTPCHRTNVHDEFFGKESLVSTVVCGSTREIVIPHAICETMLTSSGVKGEPSAQGRGKGGI